MINISKNHNDIIIIFNIRNEEQIKYYNTYLESKPNNHIKIYFNIDGQVFFIEDDVKKCINNVVELDSELIVLINNIQKLKYILDNVNEIKFELKKRALYSVLIGYENDISKYYDINDVDNMINNISKIDIMVRKSYLIKNKLELSKLEYWKSKIIIEDLLMKSFLYIYNINKFIDEVEEVCEYEYFLKNILSVGKLNKEYLKILNEKVFIKLFNKTCFLLGKTGMEPNIKRFIQIIVQYENLISKNNLNIIDENVENFIIKLQEESIENIKRLLWYQFYIKSIYTCRIYDLREDENSIIYYCVIHSEIKSEKDNELVENIEFYLNSSNNKIYLKKEYGDTTFYKDDYPHKKYINNKDNFTLTLDKNQFIPGEYELTYEFLDKKGRVILSNFALARKLEDKIIERADSKVLMKYNYQGKNIGMTIKSCDNMSIWKEYYELIKEDVKRIKESKQNKLYIFFIYFMYKYIKKICNKKIILIGETHNTYQDSGKVVFEKLKDDKNLKCYYVTSDMELLKSDKRYIKFMSSKHKIMYLLADALLNVQNIDIYMSPFINRNKNLVYKRHSKDYLIYRAFSKYLKNQKKVFLQHGVLYQAGLTNAVYINCDFDYFVVSTEFEKKIFPKSCRIPIESCLPRFSTYNRDTSNKENIILFSPTWRKFFKDLKSGNIYEDSIKESEYYVRIKSLMNNKKLHHILEKYNYKFIYNIHHTLVDLGIDDILEDECERVIINKGQYNLNDLISRSKICITDYSSLFFDFLWQDKCVLNYIYDYEDFHNRIDNNKKKSRYYNLKQYNYICNNEETLLRKLEQYLSLSVNNYKNEFLKVSDPCEKFIEVLKRDILCIENEVEK